MADLEETLAWADGVYQIEQTDSVVGGPPDLALGQGIANVQAQQLADRTGWLKAAITALQGTAVAQADIDAAIAALRDGAPGALDTLNELATALGDNDNAMVAIITQIGLKLDATSYTAADILAKMKAVDGVESGLDADMLDGLHAASFLRADVSNWRFQMGGGGATNFDGIIYDDGPNTFTFVADGWNDGSGPAQSQIITATLRAIGDGDASLGSTAHAIQAGPTNGPNVITDGNEIIARNNGAAAVLHLNNDGGDVKANDSKVVTEATIAALVPSTAYGAAVATVSGNDFYFWVPSGVREIEIYYSNLGTTAANPEIIIGDAGGLETSGYASGSGRYNHDITSTSGFLVSNFLGAKTSLNGIMTLRLIDPATNLWVSSHTMTADNLSILGGGSKALSGELTHFRLHVDSGAFDAGLVNYSYR